MRYIATFDIGTTAIKGVLVSENGEPVYAKSLNIETVFDEDKKEQRPDDWYQAFLQISHNFVAQYNKSDIIGIVMSGQMQDVILIDHENRAIDNSILYSDGRATEQAIEIERLLGNTTILNCTGNDFNGSIPFAKLLWIKQNKYDIFSKIYKVLFSSKDYIITKLTNHYVSDVTTCATTGLMDIHRKQWMKEWLEQFQISYHILPQLAYANEKAGAITESGAIESGYQVGIPVYVGTGDAGATTLASGISRDGEYNINLGTSGWVASVSADVLSRQGVFNLAAIQKDLFINVVPFLNAGNVHKWISKTLTPDDIQEQKYDYIDQLLQNSSTGSHGVMFLPYIAGERFPIMDADIKGCYIGIVPETTKQDMARACLEGVAYSIRQGIESIGRSPNRISIIGGGARCKTWCQILADMLNHDVFVYKNSEYLPSMAVASAAMIDLGIISDFQTFTNSLQASSACICYKPNETAKKYYDSAFIKYCRVYPAIRKIE
jgi:xylulokinase